MISEILIQLALIEQSLEKQNTRREAFDKRMELTIKRMVKAGLRVALARVNPVDKKLERSSCSLLKHSIKRLPGSL